MHATSRCRALDSVASRSTSPEPPPPAFLILVMTTVVSLSNKTKPKNYAARMGVQASSVAMFQPPAGSVFLVDTHDEALKRELSPAHALRRLLLASSRSPRVPGRNSHRPCSTTWPAQS